MCVWCAWEEERGGEGGRGYMCVYNVFNLRRYGVFSFTVLFARRPSLRQRWLIYTNTTRDYHH